MSWGRTGCLPEINVPTTEVPDLKPQRVSERTPRSRRTYYHGLLLLEQDLLGCTAKHKLGPAHDDRMSFPNTILQKHRGKLSVKKEASNWFQSPLMTRGTPAEKKKTAVLQQSDSAPDRQKRICLR